MSEEYDLQFLENCASPSARAEDRQAIAELEGVEAIIDGGCARELAALDALWARPSRVGTLARSAGLDEPSSRSGSRSIWTDRAQWGLS